MFKNIKNKFTTKGVMYFLLVAALLIITIDQKGKINFLESQNVQLITDINDALLVQEKFDEEYLSNITTLESVVETYESEVFELKMQLERASLETVALTASLKDAIEYPNCPVITE